MRHWMHSLWSCTCPCAHAVCERVCVVYARVASDPAGREHASCRHASAKLSPGHAHGTAARLVQRLPELPNHAGAVLVHVHTPHRRAGTQGDIPADDLGRVIPWHHSCRTYFMMYICVLRDLTGTTRLCDHIVRMLLAALSGVTAHTGETLRRRRAEKRCEVAVAPRRHGHTVHGTKLVREKSRSIPHKKPKRKRQRCGLRVPDFHTHAHQGSDSQAHSSDSSPYLRLSARSTMASWMKLATSRDIVACVLLLLLLRGCGVGRTKTSMCLGVATAHAGYLPGSQGAIAGRLRQAGP